MTVNTEDFEALPVLTYSEARGQMRTGDLVFFSSRTLGAELVEFFTESLWSHAAFVWRIDDVDRVILLESVDTFGVRARALSSALNGSGSHPRPYNGKVMLARHDAFPATPDARDVRRMTQFAIDRLGWPYSKVELAKIAARIAAGLAGHALTGALDPQDAYVCSEYVAKCYAAMGIVLTPDKAGFIAPADIADDDGVKGLCALIPDPPPHVRP
jgi:hypothetical protein